MTTPTNTPRETRMLFLDFETTGVDPRNDAILEVGAILTDGDLTELDRWSWLVSHGYHRQMLEHRDRSRDPLLGSALTMHRESGLLDALDDAVMHGTAVALWEIERDLRTDLGLKHGVAPRSLELAGFSVHFDRGFLDVLLPGVGDFLSHRIVDVSTVRGLYRRWVGEPRPQGKAHRAITDCEEAIAELRFYREQLFARAIAPGVES